MALVVRRVGPGGVVQCWDATAVVAELARSDLERFADPADHQEQRHENAAEDPLIIQ